MRKVMERKYGNCEKAVPEGNPLSTAKNIPETRTKENNAAHIKGVCVDAQKIAQLHVKV